MKRKITILFSIAFLVIVSFGKIQAANGVNISASASTLTVGQTATVTVSTDGNHTFDGSASASGAGSGSLGGIGLFTGSSQSFTVTANSVGTITITASGQSVDIYDPEVGKSASATTYITVVGNDTGGGNTGGNDGVYNPEMPKGETEEERLAREAREKAEQLERDKKIPLIESIEVISNDEKRNGKTLKTIETADETFEYAYDLPMFIENVSLKVNGVDEDVSLTFDKDHEVKENKDVTITASKGEISQEFTLKLKASNTEDKKVEDGFVYDDEELTKAFKDLGFESKEYELDGKKLSMFNKNELNLQMIVDEKNEALFYRLDEKGTLLEKGQIVVFEKDLLFVTSDVDEEMKANTLYGNKYESVALPKPAFLNEIDESITMKQVSSGWNYDDNVVVVAVDDKLEKDTYNIADEQPFKAAVVAFDGKSSPVLVYSLIASLVALIAVSIGFIVYYLQSKKRIQLLLNKKQL